MTDKQQYKKQINDLLDLLYNQGKLDGMKEIEKIYSKGRKKV